MTTLAEEGHRARPRWAAHAIQFAVLALTLCAVQADTLVSLVSIWWSTTTYNHGFLVLPVAAWLVWRRRDELAGAVPDNAYGALVLLAGFSALTLVGELSGVNLARHVGFVGALASLVPLCFGWRVVRRFAFPVAFLAFMVPVGDFLIPPLQELTADVSVWLIQLTGIPVYREGMMIELPSGIWEVAEACAGVRFLIANLFVAAVFAYFSYDRAWKWVLFAVLALAIPIGANCLRAYGIMMLAHATDNALAVGVDHLVYGWVFFAVVMLTMLWVGSLFADRRIEDPHVPADPREAEGARGGVGVALSGALLIAAAPAFADLSAPEPTALPAGMAEALAPEGWAVARLPEGGDGWRPRFPSADAWEAVRLTGPEGQEVDLAVAYWTHQREGAEALHYANRFDDEEHWINAGTGQALIGTSGTGLPASVRRRDLTQLLRSADGTRTAFRQRIVLSWVWVGGILTADPLTAKLAGMRARLTGGEAGAAIVALSTPYDREGGLPDARRAIEDALADMPPVAAALDRMGDG